MKKYFPNIACVILASGIAQRFGSNKLLTTWNGSPLICHILQITDGLFGARCVITRHAPIKELCDARGSNCLLHSEPYLSDTVRLGLEQLEQTKQFAHIQGILFAASDQPLLLQSSIIRLCTSFMQAPQKIHRLYFGSQPGNPILFPICLADKLKKLPQDKGGNVLAKKYPELVVSVQAQDKYELFDVDRQSDLAELIALNRCHCSK